MFNTLRQNLNLLFVIVLKDNKEHCFKHTLLDQNWTAMDFADEIPRVFLYARLQTGRIMVW